MTQKHRFKFDKLVRDKIPDLMHAKNIEVFEYAMEQEEYIVSLKQKLIEESEEVIAARIKTNIVEELADVVEVVRALAAAYDIEYSQIENKRLEKKEANGGFEQKKYISHIEMSADNRDMEYYLARPAKYQEIL